MSSNTSASPEPTPKTVKAAKSTKKAPAKKPASKSKPKSTSPSHPSWKEIITECIIANRDDSARSGVSRSTIKKYAQETYKLDSTGTALYQLNRAITSGAESGLFVLPKGPSGKVKLAPKVRASNENNKPPSTKKAPAKATKAPAAKPAVTKATAAAKPKTTTTAKAAPIKKAVAKKRAAKAPTKKVAVKKSAATKKVMSAKRVEKKKVAAKVAATKLKPASTSKSRSKKV